MHRLFGQTSLAVKKETLSSRISSCEVALLYPSYSLTTKSSEKRTDAVDFPLTDSDHARMYAASPLKASQKRHDTKIVLSVGGVVQYSSSSSHVKRHVDSKVTGALHRTREPVRDRMYSQPNAFIDLI